jgi:hypothetical protein
VRLYDQPIIAADSEKVVVAFTSRPVGGGIASGEIEAIQKSDLVSSGVIHQVTLTGLAVPAELAPAVTVTSSGTLWLVADQQTRAALVALTGAPDQRNVAAQDFTVPVTPIVAPPAPVQPNGHTVPIPPPRFVTAMWRSGTLWTTTMDRCTPAGSATPRSCLRLLAFRAPDRQRPRPRRTTLTSAMRTWTTSPPWWQPTTTATSWSRLRSRTRSPTQRLPCSASARRLPGLPGSATTSCSSSRNMRGRTGAATRR